MERIYLDNAATSWPKPPAVLAAIQDFYSNVGSASGRGSQASDYSSDHIVRQCRSELAEFLGAGPDDELIFAFNGTDAINLVLWGFLNHGDHVVATTIEHNSVIRPLNELQRERAVTFDLVDCDANSRIPAEAIAARISHNTKMVVVSHASNVTGVIQDLESIAEVCRQKDVALFVDAAQTVGKVEIDFAKMGCDFLVSPGHKGLLGPLGTGLVLIGARVKGQMKSWRAGGTGSESELTQQPSGYPARLESGNVNVGGISGLLAGLRFIREIGVPSISDRERDLIELAAKELKQLSGVRLLVDPSRYPHVGVLSFVVEGMDPREISMILDTSFGIQTRAGLHCAPGIHQRLGTFADGGAVRISPSWFTHEEEIRNFLAAMNEIVSV